ncbi:MAG: UvrD-helicase domain-containing protein [Bacteroidia bacterium]
MQITLYRSSAGSGKTYTLAKEYLKHVLPEPYLFRHVLAVTFTNAAAAEMKERIISFLVKLRDNTNPELKEQLLKEGLTEKDIANAGPVLRNILFDYSAFAISTIDSFFHSLLSSFGKELDLPYNFEVVMDQKPVYDHVIATLLDKAGKDEEYRSLLLNYIWEKILNSRSWNIRADLLNSISEAEKERATGYKFMKPGELAGFISVIRELASEYEDSMHNWGRQATDRMSSAGYAVADFAHGAGGIAGYFAKIKNGRGNALEPGLRILNCRENMESWVSKKTPNREAILSFAERELLPILCGLLDFTEKNARSYATCIEILKTIYTHGVLEQVQELLRDYRQENNIIFISDFNKILAEHIMREHVPFVYSRAGIKYRHFLVDEFQDTSGLQWFNLFPLLENALAEGHSSLVVGDPKQSIYRWRGGEVNLIDRQLAEVDFPGSTRQENLQQNFRSCREIITFNNELFEKVISLFNVDENELLHRVYKDAAQLIPENCKKGGGVDVTFIRQESRPVKAELEEKVREELLARIDELLRGGFQFSDIAILVRRKSEGSLITGWLFQEGISVISQESLYLERAPVTRLLFSLLRYFHSPAEDLYKAEALFFYQHYLNKEESGRDEITNMLQPEQFFTAMPRDFIQALPRLQKLNLFDLVEELVRLFELNKKADAYLQRFLDVVLNYTQENIPGIGDFLEWWEDGKYSVILPEGLDAIRVLTIHRSKGLQFPVVILPFATWSFNEGRDEMLWVETEDAPFATLGKFPVSATGSLASTIFDKEYEDEQRMKLLDSINLLYVALTRPEERLYVFTYYQPKTPTRISNLAGLLQQVAFDNDPPVEEVVHKPALAETPRMKTAEAAPSDVNFRTIASFPSEDWHHRLAILSRSHERWDPEKQEKIDWGILVHNVLSRLPQWNRLDEVLEKMRLEGIIGLDEAGRLEELLAGIFNIPQVREWFSESADVKPEAGILLPSGKLLRPDRVIFSGNKATVIDFKTGEPKAADKQQVREYAEILMEMGFLNVKKFLLYTGGDIVEV